MLLHPVYLETTKGNQEKGEEMSDFESGYLAAMRQVEKMAKELAKYENPLKHDEYCVGFGDGVVRAYETIEAFAREKREDATSGKAYYCA